MTPLLLDVPKLIVWRLDRAIFATTWDSGEGASLLGGRWSSKGVVAVYCSVDPATSILEVAVNHGFHRLDTTAYVLTAVAIDEPTAIRVVMPAEISNAHWLHPGTPSAGQQSFGDRLLAEHGFVAFPSVVSAHSWNLVFVPGAGGYSQHLQEDFALDTRLHPPIFG